MQEFLLLNKIKSLNMYMEQYIKKDIGLKLN